MACVILFRQGFAGCINPLPYNAKQYENYINILFEDTDRVEIRKSEVGRYEREDK